MHKYTLKQKKAMIEEFDSSPDHYGKLKLFNEKFGVADGFLLRARKTLDMLESRNADNGKLINGSREMNFNIKRKTIGIGRPLTYPDEEDWLYERFTLYEAHDIAVSTTMLISLVVAKFPHLNNMSEMKLIDWNYRW